MPLSRPHLTYFMPTPLVYCILVLTSGCLVSIWYAAFHTSDEHLPSSLLPFPLHRLWRWWDAWLTISWRDACITRGMDSIFGSALHAQSQVLMAGLVGGAMMVANRCGYLRSFGYFNQMVTAALPQNLAPQMRRQYVPPLPGQMPGSLSNFRQAEPVDPILSHALQGRVYYVPPMPGQMQ